MKAEDIQTLIRIFKENTIYLNGRAITLKKLGYDSYGVYRIQLETERDEVILGLPEDGKQRKLDILAEIANISQEAGEY